MGITGSLRVGFIYYGGMSYMKAGLDRIFSWYYRKMVSLCTIEPEYAELGTASLSISVLCFGGRSQDGFVRELAAAGLGHRHEAMLAAVVAASGYGPMHGLHEAVGVEAVLLCGNCIKLHKS